MAKDMALVAVSTKTVNTTKGSGKTIDRVVMVVKSLKITNNMLETIQTAKSMARVLLSLHLVMFIKETGKKI